MTASQFEKAQKLYKTVQDITAEIIQIESIAETIASRQTKVVLSLRVDDLTAVEEEKGKVSFDQDGSLIHGVPTYNPMQSLYSMFRIPDGRIGIASCKSNSGINKEYSISDTVTLQVLGVLLADKIQERNNAMKLLAKIGVSL